MSGGGVKGGRGSRMRSAAEGEHRTGEHPAQRTLDPAGATNATGYWGGLVYNPPRLPRGECGVWGGAPRSQFGQLLPLVVSTKPPQERLLHFETCQMVDSHNSAIAAVGVGSVEWPVLCKLPTLRR
jgi:hypothetical protein